MTLMVELYHMIVALFFEGLFFSKKVNAIPQRTYIFQKFTKTPNKFQLL